MLFDLSPYLPFNAFVALWVGLMFVALCVAHYLDNKKGK
jgi:hypothetical protein